MKRIILILILFLIFSNLIFGQEKEIYILNDEKYGDLSDGMPENDTIIKIPHRNGKVEAIGKMAINKSGISNLKIGHWKEYNDNGILKREGKYKLGSYIQCCFSGHCRQFYFYRDGVWKYYDDKGVLRYEMEFEPTKLHIETSCQGGDDFIFGLVQDIPLKYAGIITPDLIYENQKVKINDDHGTYKLVPINGHIYRE